MIQLVNQSTKEKLAKQKERTNMKLTNILFCTALLGGAVLAANIASAQPGYFNISGTATTDKYTSTTTGYKYTIEKSKFSNKDVMTLLANATGQFWISNKNSRLMYNLDAYNAAATHWYGEDVYGIFWVTNTVNHAPTNYYRLDNTNTATAYWSFIELDYNDWELGFFDPFNIIDDTPVGVNSADNEVYVSSPYKNSGRELGSDAILYVHDYPYDYDYLDFGASVLFDSNEHAAVIRGPIIVTWNETSSSDSYSIFLQGAGDGVFYISGTWYYPVMTGRAMYSSKATAAP
jgi:hypothetical protein